MEEAEQIMAAPAGGDGDDTTIATLLSLLQQREEQVQRLINTVQKDRQEIALLRDRFARLVQAARHFAKMGAVLTLRSVRSGGTKAALASGERRDARRMRPQLVTPPSRGTRLPKSPPPHPISPTPSLPSLHILENGLARRRGPRRRRIRVRKAGAALPDGTAAGGWGGGRRGGGGGVGAVTNRVGGIGWRVGRRRERPRWWCRWR